MNCSTCQSKLLSDHMKYRATCLWLCLIWKDVLFLASLEKQDTNIKWSLSHFLFINPCMKYYTQYTDIFKTPRFPLENDLSKQTCGQVSGWETSWAKPKASWSESQCWNWSMPWSYLAKAEPAAGWYIHSSENQTWSMSWNWCLMKDPNEITCIFHLTPCLFIPICSFFSTPDLLLLFCLIAPTESLTNLMECAWHGPY